MSATIEAEQEDLKREAEGLKEEIRRAKDEITRLQAGDLLPETSLDGWNFRDLDRKYGSGIRGGQRLFGAGMGAEAVRERITRLDLEGLATRAAFRGAHHLRACAARRPSSGCASSRPSAAPARAPSG